MGPPNEHWQIRKPAVVSTSGLVAAQSARAATVGAKILATGGNAVDAAVATGFALGVCEPWMSGIGGCGYMVVHLAGEGRTHVVDFSTVSPGELDPGRYGLVGGTTPGMFTWPAVEGDRNLVGHESICVPGTVDGFGLALEKFGTISFADAIGPAIALAEAGMPVDWFASLAITGDARALLAYPASRALFLPDGLPPVSAAGAPLTRIRFDGLAETLRRLADGGRREFYEGGIARDVVKDVRAGGGRLAMADMSGYRARLTEPLEVDYRGVTLQVPPGLNGGPTLVQAMNSLSKVTLAGLDGPGAAAYAALSDALIKSYATRFRKMGHAGIAGPPSCTSHVSVVDAEGNLVSLTNTLLARFGSHVVLPQTGILMNNGMMWFDPRPGQPNSIAPGRQPLSNMCPVVATRDGESWLAIGAAGGRQIVPAIVQILSFLTDFDLSLEDAFHLPRIDVSDGSTVICDQRMADDLVTAIGARHPIRRVEATVHPVMFAHPNAVMRGPMAGTKTGMASPISPWATVAQGA
ncbi:MAG: gamma-glutamyltransferase family protein [Alphaproteobacteria bacterium]